MREHSVALQMETIHFITHEMGGKELCGELAHFTHPDL